MINDQSCAEIPREDFKSIQVSVTEEGWSSTTRGSWYDELRRDDLIFAPAMRIMRDIQTDARHYQGI